MDRRVGAGVEYWPLTVTLPAEESAPSASPSAPPRAALRGALRAGLICALRPIMARAPL